MFLLSCITISITAQNERGEKYITVRFSDSTDITQLTKDPILFPSDLDHSRDKCQGLYDKEQKLKLVPKWEKDNNVIISRGVFNITATM